MKRFIDKLTYIFLLVLSLFVRILSRKLQLILGKVFGRIFMVIFPSRVKIAHDNLQHAFPEKSDNWIKQVAKESFENLGITLIEILLMKYWSAEKINKIVKFRMLNYSKNYIVEIKE